MRWNRALVNDEVLEARHTNPKVLNICLFITSHWM
jgi:hypothetical protein